MPTGSDVRVTFTGDTSQLTAASKQASAAIASTGEASDKAAKAAAKAAAAQEKAAQKAAETAAREAAKIAAAQQKAADAAAKEARRAADIQAREAQRAADAQARAAADAAAAQVRAAQEAQEAQERAAREQQQQMERLGQAMADMAAAAQKAGARLQDIGDSTDEMVKARTEADRLLAEIDLLEKQTGDTAAAERARAAVLSRLDDEQKRIAASANDSADKIGKVGSASGKLAGFLGVLSPELADATRNIGDLADGGELAAEASATLGVGLGAVAAGAGLVASAVALVAAAYAGWNEEAATATRLTEQQNALTAALAPLYEDTEAAIRASRVELGLMTEAQAAMVESGIAGLARYQEATEATRKRLAELRASQASMTGQVQQFLGDVGEALPLQEYNVLAQVIDAATTSSSEFATEEGRLQGGLSGAAVELKRNREAHAALTAAKGKGKAATVAMITADEAAEAAAKAREAAERRLSEFLAERAKAEKDYADALASIRAMESEANADRLTEIEALTAARDEQIATLNRTLTEQLAATEGNAIRQAEIEQAGADARLAIEQRYQRDKGEITAEGNARIAEENAAALADLEEQNRAAAEAIYQVSGDLFGSVSDLAGSLMDAGLAKSKEGLRALFGVQQAAAVAQAAINTALAVSNALALPLPPPLPQIAAVAAGIAGAAQVAAITSTAPPSFRSGYMPDQQLAFIEPQSEIVAPASAVQAMGGKDAAREVFAGMSGGGAPTVTRFTMGHREFSALVQGSATRPGPLRDLTVRPSTRYDPHHRR